MGINPQISIHIYKFKSEYLMAESVVRKPINIISAAKYKMMVSHGK